MRKNPTCQDTGDAQGSDVSSGEEEDDIGSDDVDSDDVEEFLGSDDNDMEFIIQDYVQL